MICIGVPFGFDPSAFVPVTVGRDYTLPSHLNHLATFRDDFTVITGLSHPNTGGGGHKAEAVMLTGAPYPDYSHNLKNTISVDQAFAAKFRGQTRYESFALTTQGPSLSVTANGVSIPGGVQEAFPRRHSRRNGGRNAPHRRRPQHARFRQ